MDICILYIYRELLMDRFAIFAQLKYLIFAKFDFVFMKEFIDEESKEKGLTSVIIFVVLSFFFFSCMN